MAISHMKVFQDELSKFKTMIRAIYEKSPFNSYV